jgi:hypothetical protein
VNLGRHDLKQALMGIFAILVTPFGSDDELAPRRWWPATPTG